jgi:hypothetical protein
MDRILYAYLNIEHPMVAWEVAIGRLRSICDIELDNFGISLWQYSLFKNYSQNGQTKQYINEFKLEQIRQKKYPESVSRLQGLYFFKSENDAYIALDKWGMQKKKKYISAVRFKSKRLTEVDSEWITNNLGSSNRTDWMHEYWQGNTFGVAPLTEILASGIGIVLNKALRIKAYKTVYKLWPTSTPLLVASCCAFQLLEMDDIAMTVPALTMSDGLIKGKFYINLDELENKQKEIGEAIATCKKKGECPPYVMPEDPTKIFTVGDFTDQNFEISSKIAYRAFESVHQYHH